MLKRHEDNIKIANEVGIDEKQKNGSRNLKINKLFILLFFGSIAYSLYPIIYKYYYNAETLNLSLIIKPFFIAILVGIIAFLLSWVIIRNPATSFLNSFLYIYIFWNFISIVAFCNNARMVLGLKIWHEVVFLFAVPILVLAILYRMKNNNFIKNISIILSAVFILLNICNIFMLSIAETKKYIIEKQQTIDNISNEISLNKKYDFYYLIIDGYSNTQSMMNCYNYGNSPFEDYLKSIGFYVTKDSRSRVARTMGVLPGLLNFEYVDNISSISASELEEFWDHKVSKKYVPELLKLYNNNKLFEMIKKSGYKIYDISNFDNIYPNVKFANTDISYRYTNDNISEFDELVFSNSILELLSDTNTKNNWYYYLSNMFCINKLNEIAREPSPKFVFSHVLMMHRPFVFDINGNFIGNYDKNADLPLEKDHYKEQYIYTTKRYKEIVENIMEVSKGNAIIIIQSDHGHHTSQRIDRIDKARIFNAVYFPDKVYSGLYENIGAVNLLRIIANKYFGQNYEMTVDY